MLQRSAFILALQIVIQARGLIQVPFLTRALTPAEVATWLPLSATRCQSRTTCGACRAT